ncbi:hypothetical protein HA466_0088470 [Hirschfeldia incana]|nr:hypothetical protein HA466_0088470 [Hirschfeldia incana]
MVIVFLYCAECKENKDCPPEISLYRLMAGFRGSPQIFKVLGGVFNGVPEKHKCVADLIERERNLLESDLMGQMVKLVVGVWEQVGQRGWLFLEDPTERQYEIMVHENQTYASVMDLVRTRYSVGLETAVTLTYEFPEWMKAPGELSSPPVDVKEDGDVELFMSIKIELPGTKLMVTIGNDVVARYLFQRREDYTVIGSSRGMLHDKKQSYRPTTDVNTYEKTGNGNATRGSAPDGSVFWEELLAQCIMTASQQYVTNVCGNEDVTLGGKKALGGIMPEPEGYIVSSDGTDSSTDSSPGPAEKGDELFETGIISLAEEIPVVPGVTKKALAIVEPQAARKASTILEYLTKGKEKVCNEKEGKRKRSYQSGHRSPLMANPNFPDPIPDADTTDEDGYDLVFISDRHQSIYAGLHKVYPMAKHYACVLHLQRNIVSMFKKKHLAYLVSKAARAYRVSDFYKHFNEIKMIDINCADYLIRVGFEHWARSHSGGQRYNLMTSNVAESLNAALAEAREYPIVALVEYIRGMLMGWFSVRREASGSFAGLVTPKVEELISRNFNVSTGFLVRHITKAEFEVRGKEGVPFCVDLERKTCSCLEFDMLHIPCGHAVAAAIHSNRRVDELVGEELSRNNWAGAYSLSINPAGEEMAPTHEDDTLASLKLAPPNTRRPPGRPKKIRILSRGEFKRGVLGRKVRTCKRCGGKDHNRATCKNPI